MAGPAPGPASLLPPPPPLPPPLPPLGAQPPPSTPAPPAPVLQPEALALIHELAKTYGAQKTFSADLTLTFSRQHPKPFTETRQATIHLLRPNKFALRHTKGRRGFSIIFDGETVHTLENARQRYTVAHCTGTLEDFVSAKHLNDAFTRRTPLLPLLDILIQRTAEKRLKSGLQTATLTTTEDHRLLTLEWHDQRLDIEIAPAAPTILAILPAAPQGMTIRHAYSNWTFTPQPAEAFHFTPPEKATKVTHIFR